MLITKLFSDEIFYYIQIANTENSQIQIGNAVVEMEEDSVILYEEGENGTYWYGLIKLNPKRQLQQFLVKSLKSEQIFSFQELQKNEKLVVCELIKDSRDVTAAGYTRLEFGGLVGKL